MHALRLSSGSNLWIAVSLSQSSALPMGQSPGFWRDVRDQILPNGSDWIIDLEIPYDDVPANVGATQTITESSIEVMRSSLSPSTPKPLGADHSKIMMSFLPKLEIDVPEFSAEEFKQKWEMLPCSSHDKTILIFFEYAVYLSSNNMLKPDQTNAILRWLMHGGNQMRLGALISSKMPTAMAFIHRIFKCALLNGHLQVARTLLRTGINFSEVLQSSRWILEVALQTNNVELTQFFLEGEVDAKLFTGILWHAKSIETTQLLLQAGLDVNEFNLRRQFYLTALGNSVLDRNFELAEFLIEKGADVNLAGGTEDEDDEERTPLRAAVEMGDIRLVKLLLHQGAEVNTPSYPWEEDKDHWATPLQVAAASGNVKLAALLLRSGADVNADFYEMSALHWAVKSGSIEAVQLLLTHGADPNTPAGYECRSTPIQIAAEYGNTDAIQILLTAGAISNTVDQCPLRGQLRQAIKDGDIGRVRRILRSDIDVSEPFSDHSTILQEAISIDDPGMVQILVDAGADVNTPCRGCPDGGFSGGSFLNPGDIVTPLQLALEFRDWICNMPRLNAAQIAKILLNAGADPNPPDIDGALTPLQFAAAWRDQAQAYDLVQLLLIRGASVNAPAGDWKTPLQLAVQRWNRSTGFDLLQLLLKYGADVNAPGGDDYGGTALQIAVEIGDTDLVKYLLKFGANVNTPGNDESRRTALHEAVRVNNVGLIRLLLNNGADINPPVGSHYGKTMLQEAIEMWGNKSAENPLEEQRLKAVKFLMEKGANINVPPAVIGGRTVLQAAAAATTENCSIELMQYLLDAGADVNAPAGEEKGLTALQGAAIRGHMKFALMLLERDADVNAPGSRVNGRTALEGAAEHGRLDMVQLLINVGADSHLPGRQRYRSAARFAAKQGHIAVANLLRGRFEE